MISLQSTLSRPGFPGQYLPSFDYYIHGVSPGILAVYLLREVTGDPIYYERTLVFSEGQYDVIGWQTAYVALNFTVHGVCVHVLVCTFGCAHARACVCRCVWVRACV